MNRKRKLCTARKTNNFSKDYAKETLNHFFITKNGLTAFIKLNIEDLKFTDLNLQFIQNFKFCLTLS